MQYDPDYAARARQAVIEVGRYFSSGQRLRQALGLGPGSWFQGTLPSPKTLKRIEAFLVVAQELDQVSGDRLRTGRYLAQKGHRSALERRRRWVIEQGREHFQRNRADYVPPRSEWLKTLTERHQPILDQPTGRRDRRRLGAEALGGLLSEIIADA